MLQKKDEQRNVTLEQKLNSSAKADVTTSSSHNAKPNVARSFCLTDDKKIDEILSRFKTQKSKFYDFFSNNINSELSSLSE